MIDLEKAAMIDLKKEEEWFKYQEGVERNIGVAFAWGAVILGPVSFFLGALDVFAIMMPLIAGIFIAASWADRRRHYRQTRDTGK